MIIPLELNSVRTRALLKRRSRQLVKQSTRSTDRRDSANSYCTGCSSEMQTRLGGQVTKPGRLLLLMKHYLVDLNARTHEVVSATLSVSSGIEASQ